MSTQKKEKTLYTIKQWKLALIATAVTLAVCGAGVGVGYAIWHGQKNSTDKSWNFNNKDFSKLDREATQISNGRYDAFTAAKEYNKNFVNNFRVDIAHYVDDSVRTLASTGDVDYSYNVSVKKHDLDPKKGLIKDFEAEISFTLYVPYDPKKVTEKLDIVIHNYFLIGAFTPSDIYQDNLLYGQHHPAHIDAIAGGPLSGNYLSFAPQYDDFGFWGEDASAFHYSGPNLLGNRFTTTSFFNSRGVSIFEGDGVQSNDYGLYFKSWIFKKIPHILPINLILPNSIHDDLNDPVELTNKLTPDVDHQDFCTYFDIADDQHNHAGKWFQRVEEKNELNWEEPIDTNNAGLFSTYIDCLPNNMKNLTVGGEKYSISKILTSIDLRAYDSSDPAVVEPHQAVWDEPTHLYTNLVMHIAVNPVFSLYGIDPNDTDDYNNYAYTTSLVDNSLAATLYSYEK